jgi:hypothetical protein
MPATPTPGLQQHRPNRYDPGLAGYPAERNQGIDRLWVRPADRNSIRKGRRCRGRVLPDSWGLRVPGATITVMSDLTGIDPELLADSRMRACCAR